MTIPIILLELISVLNVIDYLQTTYLVQLFGIGIEINPVARFLFETNCEWVKLAIVPILLTVLGFIIKAEKKLAWSAWILFVLYAFVVINNFLVLIRMGAL